MGPGGVPAPRILGVLKTGSKCTECCDAFLLLLGQKVLEVTIREQVRCFQSMTQIVKCMRKEGLILSFGSNERIFEKGCSDFSLRRKSGVMESKGRGNLELSSCVTSDYSLSCKYILQVLQHLTLILI